MSTPTATSQGSITIHPIGVIRSSIAEQRHGGFEDQVAQIVLDPQFAPYLIGLEEYSHIKVIYWLSEQTETHAIHRPQGRAEVPEVGMLACR